MNLRRSRWIHYFRLLYHATIYEFHKRTIFRMGFFIREILQGITRPMMMIFVYGSICQQQPGQKIHGYDFPELVRYLILAALLQKLVFGNRGLDLATQIFDGYITKYFIMPLPYSLLAIARFLQFILVQIVVVLLIYGVGLFWIPEWWPTPNSWQAGIQAMSLVFIGSYCFFLMYFIINIFAFWLELVWTLLVGGWFISGFISGVLIPVSLMPASVQKIFYWTFPYWTISAPVEIFIGKRHDFLEGVLILSGTLIFLELLRQFCWTRGVRKYTGVGM
ncbi:MAG: ABC-2 family transporter protein [Planctomycetota bacterium]